MPKIQECFEKHYAEVEERVNKRRELGMKCKKEKDELQQVVDQRSEKVNAFNTNMYPHVTHWTDHSDWKTWLRDHHLKGIKVSKPSSTTATIDYVLVQICGVGRHIQNKSNEAVSTSVFVAIVFDDAEDANLINIQSNILSYERNKPLIGTVVLLPNKQGDALTFGDGANTNSVPPTKNIIQCKPELVLDAMYYVCKNAPSTISTFMDPNMLATYMDAFKNGTNTVLTRMGGNPIEYAS